MFILDYLGGGAADSNDECDMRVRQRCGRWKRGTTEAEIDVRGPQVKECQQPPEAGRHREPVLPWGIQRECGSVDTLILDFCPPEP